MVAIRSVNIKDIQIITKCQHVLYIYDRTAIRIEGIFILLCSYYYTAVVVHNDALRENSRGVTIRKEARIFLYSCYSYYCGGAALLQAGLVGWSCR